MDDLLDGRRRAQTEDEMTLDRLLTALRAPGTADELRGLDAATAAFVQARAEAATAPTLVAVGGRARRSVAAGVAVAAVLATVSVGAAAAAAYTGNLPRPLQEAAHQVIGAPAPQSTEASDEHPTGNVPTSSRPSGSPSGSGPAVTSGAPALFGLCTAFRDRGPGAVPTGSVAYRDLLAAASAANQDIAQYCAGVLPGGSHHPTAAPTHKPTPRATPRATPRVTPTPRATPSRKPAEVPRASTHTASVPTQASSGR